MTSQNQPSTTQSFTISSSLSPAAACAAAADLTRVSEWDRGVRDPRQIEGDGPGLGARYEVSVLGFDGAPTTLIYEITVYDAPNRFVMVGSNDAMRLEDTLVFEESENGSTLVYTAILELLGGPPPLSSADLEGVFAKVARVAEQGLTEFLNPPPS